MLAVGLESVKFERDVVGALCWMSRRVRRCLPRRRCRAAGRRRWCGATPWGSISCTTRAEDGADVQRECFDEEDLVFVDELGHFRHPHSDRVLKACAALWQVRAEGFGDGGQESVDGFVVGDDAVEQGEEGDGAPFDFFHDESVGPLQAAEREEGAPFPVGSSEHPERYSGSRTRRRSSAAKSFPM